MYPCPLAISIVKNDIGSGMNMMIIHYNLRERGARPFEEEEKSRICILRLTDFSHRVFAGLLGSFKLASSYISGPGV